MTARGTERRAPWRDNIEAAVMAVAMALFLKHFVIEAYKIPTGSMQPTLIGDEGADIKDRILVNKLSYALRAPKRWEVAVFRYPLDRSKHFVKRIVGVGPEEFRVQLGDLWQRSGEGDWRILRRPPEVMEQHWKRLDELDGDQSHWIPENLPRSSDWSATERSLSVRGSGSAAFRGGHESILDDYLDGYPEELIEWLPPHRGESSRNLVGDLRVEGRVRALPGAKALTVILREGARRYRFELPGPAAPQTALARIDAGPSARPSHFVGEGERLPSKSEYRLPAGQSVRFAVQNLDDRLSLELDGEPLLGQEIEPAQDQFSSAVLAFEGEGAELDELMVYRDIYYTTGKSQPIQIPAGSYYMMGDNTQDSSDSREWTYTVYETIADDGSLERHRGNWRNGENPRTVLSGDALGPMTLLVDEWGEKHWFHGREAVALTPELAPFVPRSMIQGKALAVFWPLDPIRGIWRLKWVN